MLLQIFPNFAPITVDDPQNMEDFDYRPGDFVAFGKTVGHVSNVYADRRVLVLDAYFLDEAHKELSISSFFVYAERTSVRHATQEECDEIGFAMLSRGIVLNGWRRMKKVKQWVVGSYVKVVSGDTVLYGIVTELDIPRVTIGSASIGGRLEYYSFSLADSKMDWATAAGKRRVMEELSSSGYKWNSRSKAFEKTLSRVPVGSVYWYVTETLSVRTSKDCRTAKHNDRFASGNYFLTAGDAAGAVMALQKYILGLRDDEVSSVPSIGNRVL